MMGERLLHMKTSMHFIGLSVVATGALLMTACGGSEGTATPDGRQIAKLQAHADSARKAFEADFKPVMADLSGIRDSIHVELSKLDSAMAKLKPKDKGREEKEAMKAEVLREQALVNEAIAKIQDATESTWGDFKVEAHAAAKQAREWWAGIRDDQAVISKVNGGQ